MKNFIGEIYQIQEHLGQGLQGEVYRVQGPEGEQALKLLKAQEPAALAALKREFSLLKSLHHPNIIQLGNFGWDDLRQAHFWTMDYVAGPLLGAPNNFSIAQLQELFLQALQGVAYLHSQGIIHGDLKPANLKCQPNQSKTWQLKILDFGLANLVQAGSLGTPAYTAPERILGEGMDERSDLYSLGLIFYEALTGQHPLIKTSLEQTLAAHLQEKVRSATLVRPEISPKLSEILNSLLAKNPRHRPKSAQSILRDFFDQRISHWRPPLPDLSLVHLEGREKILQVSADWLEKQGNKPQASSLIFVGPPELGGDQVLGELKYRAQVKGLAFHFAKSQDLDKLFQEKKILIEQDTWLLSASAQQVQNFQLQNKKNIQIIHLKALSMGELKNLLEKLSQSAVPQALIESLWHYTQGASVLLEKALQSLLKDSNILQMDASWNLSPFLEAPPTPEALGLDQKDRPLADSLSPPEVWHLQLKQAAHLASSGKNQAALKKLNPLEKKLSKIFEGQNRWRAQAELLEKKAWIQIRLGQNAQARENLAKASAHLELNSQKESSQSLRIKNFLYYLDLQAGKLAKAESGFQNTAKLSQSLDQKEQLKITNNELGQVYLAQNKNQLAREQFKKDLIFFEKIGDWRLQMKAHYNLAESYTAQSQYEKSETHYQAVLHLARGKRHWAYLLRAYNGLGNLANRQRRRARALDFYTRALSLAEYEKEYLSQASILQNLGVLHAEEEDFEAAIKALEKSQSYLKKIDSSSHSRQLMVRALLELGEIYLKKHSYDAAKSSFQEALHRSEEEGGPAQLSFYPLLGLAKVAKAEKDQNSLEKILPQVLHHCQNPEQEKLLEAFQENTKKLKQTKQSQAWQQTEKPKQSFEQEALKSLLETHRSLLDEKNPPELFEKILSHACELSGAESGLLLELSDSGELKPLKAFNLSLDEAFANMSQTVAKTVLANGKPSISHNALEDKSFNQFESVMHLKLKSIACLPIKYHQKLLGLLYLTHRHLAALFEKPSLDILEAFALQAGLALKNAREFENLKQSQASLSLELQEAQGEIKNLKKDLRSQLKNTYSQILGASPAMLEVLKQVDVISDTNLSVLILGETGTGKEGLARAIHQHSTRSSQAFVALNCGAMPANLMESEIFGYKKGAFTGADRDKAGLLSEAQGGTLFLDEVAELPLELQAKLLRVLQEKEFRPLGSNKNEKADFRLISATHQALEDWVQQGKFREDLFYRLNPMRLTLPPLKDRPEDIPILAKHFLKKAAKEMGIKKIPQAKADLLNSLLDYHWPGNVRELENTLKTAAAFAVEGQVGLENLPNFLKEKLASKTKPPVQRKIKKLPISQNLTWQDLEKKILTQAYSLYQGEIKFIAKHLEIILASAYQQINRLKKDPAWQKQTAESPSFEQEALKKLKIKIIRQRTSQLGSPSAAAKSLKLSLATIYKALA